MQAHESQGDDEAIARAILKLLHGIADPSAAELDAARRQVRRDPEGSAWLAGGMTGDPPDHQNSLRTARARGVYLGVEDDRSADRDDPSA